MTKLPYTVIATTRTGISWINDKRRRSMGVITWMVSRGRSKILSGHTLSVSKRY